MICDHLLKERLKKSTNLAVPWYLMAAYAYYECDDPILSDVLYDTLAKGLLIHWDKIEHVHKYLITKEDLEAGSLLGVVYPEMTKSAAHGLMDAILEKT